MIQREKKEDFFGQTKKAKITEKKSFKQYKNAPPPSRGTMREGDRAARAF